MFRLSYGALSSPSYKTFADSRNCFAQRVTRQSLPRKYLIRGLKADSGAGVFYSPLVTRPGPQTRSLFRTIHLKHQISRAFFFSLLYSRGTKDPKHKNNRFGQPKGGSGKTTGDPEETRHDQKSPFHVKKIRQQWRSTARCLKISSNSP